MSVSLLIGKRVLLSRENRLLINLTTWVAVLGVGLGVAALIVVNAVYDGYIAEIQNKFISVLAHVTLSGRFQSDGSIRGDEDFMKFLEEQPGVTGAAPLISRQALMMPRRSWNARRAGAAIFGMDLERARNVSGLLSRIDEGGISNPASREIVLRRALAERLELTVGDTVVVLTNFDSSGPRPQMSTNQLKVVGIFRSGSYQIDQALSYVSMETARDLFDVREGVADMVQLRLEDPWQADAVAAAVRRNVPNAEVRTWREENAQFFQGVEITRYALLLILLLLVLVACTNVIGSLIMMVNDRTRQIGILRAMGATRSSLATIFLICGLFIGLLGVVVGFLIALAITGALRHRNFIAIPESVYFIDHLPVVIDTTKVIAVSVATVVITLAASVIPAMRAARLDPVEALRYE